MKPKLDTEKTKNNVKPVKLDIEKTVKKSNILNELRNSNASLVEYRLFCVYLAHLSLNKEENVVAFTLADYARIVGLDRPRREDLEAQSANVVRLTALVENPDGGFSNRPVFSDFTLYRDEEEQQWMVSLECHPKLAPLIREQKGRFLRYKLYNTIYLKSFNQQRIYEILKQYEKIGTRTETLEDLRAYLSIGAKEYPRWADFGQKVLKVAQKALKEHTDIYFEYEPVKKGKKVVAVKFDIFKNEEFIDRLHIEEFAPSQEVTVEYDGEGFEVHSPEDSQEPEQLSIDTQEVPENLSQEEQERLAFYRTALKDPSRLNDRQLEECVKLAKGSACYASYTYRYSADELERMLHDYIVRQDLYTHANYTSSYYGFLRLACAENYAKVPSYNDQGSFDTDDFYEAAVRRSLGDDYDIPDDE